MPDAFPMICACTLGQGGGPAYLRDVGVFHDFEDLVERSVVKHRRVVTGYAIVVRENLAEPTRKECYDTRRA